MEGRTVAAPTLDPAHRSRGALDTGDRLVDPAPALPAPERIAVDSPAAAPVVGAGATPTPPPPPPGRTTSDSGGSGGSGGSSGGGAAPAPVAPATGGWNYDPDVSWYGPGFYGNRTACGHTYSQSIHGVAHKTLPCGTKVTLRHGSRSVRVAVIDRGPYVGNREYDLTQATAQRIGFTGHGPLLCTR